MSRIKVVSVRTIVSTVRSTIKRCVRWDKNKRNVNIRGMERKRERGNNTAGGE